MLELTEAGMPERQADSVVRLQSRLIEQHFATRADVEQINSAIESLRLATEAQFETERRAGDAQFETSRLSIEATITSLMTDLIKWMIGANLTFATLVIAKIRIL